MSIDFEAEIERNFDFFQQNLGRFLPARQGQFALLQNCVVAGFYPTAVLAEAAGEAKYPDQAFSIQQVTSEKVDLGFFSYAFANG